MINNYTPLGKVQRLVGSPDLGSHPTLKKLRKNNNTIIDTQILHNIQMDLYNNGYVVANDINADHRSTVFHVSAICDIHYSFLGGSKSNDEWTNRDVVQYEDIVNLPWVIAAELIASRKFEENADSRYRYNCTHWIDEDERELILEGKISPYGIAQQRKPGIKCTVYTKISMEMQEYIRRCECTPEDRVAEEESRVQKQRRIRSALELLKTDKQRRDMGKLMKYLEKHPGVIPQQKEIAGIIGIDPSAWSQMRPRICNQLASVLSMDV